MNLTYSAVRFALVLSAFFGLNCGGNAPERSKKEDDMSKNMSEPQQRVEKSQAHVRHYDLTSPRVSYELPEALQEVSGLSYDGNGIFYMIEDENGVLYRWDENSQSLVSKQKFGKDDDYEGVEVVNDQVFVLKHTGTLYQMSKSEGEELEAEKHGTFLKGDNDVEGLGYVEKEGILLLACKEPYQQDDDYEKELRVIYAFDIANQELREDPYIRLNMYQLQKDLGRLNEDAEIRRVLYDFNPDKRKALAPSGVAVHPLNGHIYVLAHRSQMLLVLNHSEENTEVVTAYYLDRKLFEQPEGICFKEDGSLYISNESEEGRATLLGFEYYP